MLRGRENAIFLMDEIGSFIINDKINFRIENIVFQQKQTTWRADFLILSSQHLKSFEIYVEILTSFIN